MWSTVRYSKHARFEPALQVSVLSEGAQYAEALRVSRVFAFWGVAQVATMLRVASQTWIGASQPSWRTESTGSQIMVRGREAAAVYVHC